MWYNNRVQSTNREGPMHIESYTSGNNTYLRLAENVTLVDANGATYKKKNIVLNLGNMNKYDDGNPDYLERLRESFAQGEPLIPQLAQYLDEKPQPAKPQNYLMPKNLGALVLDAFFDALEASSVITRHKSRKKVSYDLLGLSKLLVFGRILRPKSKRKTFEQRDKYAFPVTDSDHLHQIYYSLDELDAMKRSLLQRFNTVISRNGQRRTELTYYDVTNYYFEIDESDPDVYDDKGKLVYKGSRKKGVSKENRKLPLIQMGLLIDQEGLPITYDLYSGNTLDHSTFQPSLQRLKDEITLDRIIVVADRGMINNNNLLALGNNGYVMSKSIKKSNKEEKEWTIDPQGYSGQPGDDFRIKSRIISKKIKNKEGVTVTLKQKQVVYWSRRFYLREMRENEKFLSMLEKFVENPNSFPISRYKGLSKFIGTCQVDKETGEIIDTKALQFVKEEKVKEFSKFFGYYMIVTSEIDKPDGEIIDIYRGLTRIESCFRTIKSDLEGRPVFVNSDSHIEAHFMICFMALLIVRLLQRQILRFKELPTTNSFDWEEGLSANRIQEALRGMESNVQRDGTHQLTKPSEDLELILESLGIEHPGAECSYSDLVQFKNKLKKRVKQLV